MDLQLQDWLTLFACSAGLALAVLVIWRGRGSAMVLPLALLSIDFCCFNLATMFFELSGRRMAAFNILDKASAPFGMPLGLHFVLAFVGRRRNLRGVLGLSYLCAALIAAVALLSPWLPWAARFIDTRNNPAAGWSIANISHLVLVFGLGMTLLVVHSRSSRDAEERARTRVVMTAIAVLAVGGGSELLPGVQGAAPVACTLFTMLLSSVTLRLSLFDVRVPKHFLPAAALAGLLAAGALVLLFGGMTPDAALMLLVAMFALSVVLTIVIGVLASRALEAEKLEKLALQGSFSSLLSHNLKNPLAALKGAAQYLRVELDAGRSVQDQGELVDLVLTQVLRLEGALENYERLGKVEAVPVDLQVNDVVKSVLALQPYRSPAVQVRVDLEEGLPPCRADPELLGQALDNLARNAFEAMPDGGQVIVSTRRGIGEITVGVSDTGCGMDLRTRERAERGGYTTKSSGSGLGLAFVRRVAQAHHGRLRITSREGEGTTVRLSLPV